MKLSSGCCCDDADVSSESIPDESGAGVSDDTVDTGLKSQF